MNSRVTSSTLSEIWENPRLDDLDALTEKIKGEISVLRALNCQTSITTENNENPIPGTEATVQALRYYHGFLYVLKHQPDQHCQRHIQSDLTAILAKISAEQTNHFTPQATHWLAESLTNIIQRALSIPDAAARRQLTMARDLALMLETHAPVSTKVNAENQTSTISSHLHKVFNTSILTNFKHERWFQLAKIWAGFKTTTSWLDHFFEHHAAALAANGVPVPPSARWLPLPANAHHVDISSESQPDGSDKRHFHLMTTGTLVPFEIADHNLQQSLAETIFKELALTEITKQIADFRQLYGFNDDEKVTFAIAYQTLLSPIIGEQRLPHKDNNAHFVNLTKNVVLNSALSGELQKAAPNVNLMVYHTNTAINRHALFAIKDSYAQSIRNYKVGITKQIIIDLIKSRYHLIDPAITSRPDLATIDQCDLKLLLAIIQAYYQPPALSQALFNEIETRAKASISLLDIINKKTQTALQPHQRNLMIAALEALMLGSQTVTIAGCKSGRDRTAVFLAAIKAMLENPDAMHHWPTLLHGINQTLLQGHFFRNNYNAILKLDCVHREYMQSLSPNLINDIKALKPFSKKLGTKKSTQFSPTLFRTDPIDLHDTGDIELKEIHHNGENHDNDNSSPRHY